MIPIHTISPVSFALPTTVRATNSSLATTTIQDFPTMLSAQAKNPRASVDAVNTQTQTKLGIQAPRLQDTGEVLEHLLACRTMSFYAASRVGRSALGAPTTTLPLPDCISKGVPVLDSTGTVDLTCSAERSTFLRAEHIRGMLVRRTGFCSNGLVDDFSFECLPKSSTISEERPASFVVWITVESIRVRAQWVRPRRRRDPPSSDAHRGNELSGNTDDAE
jgi:hypothetical protein